MGGISRRSALVAAFGSVASAASVGAWLVGGWVQDTVPAAGRRIRTSFGSVVVLASRREPSPSHQIYADGSGGVLQDDGTDRVVALVEVRNESPRPVRVAPGQFRLRIGRQGPTAAFLGAEPHGGVVAAGRVLQLRLTFLAPPGTAALGLEFWEAGTPVSQVAAVAPAAGSGPVPA